MTARSSSVRPGQRYSIVLQNHTSHRFEAVGTVDGLDVINGKPGTFDNRGYVLLPFATLEIEGFRTSTRAVAAFRFASVADSYAAQTGSARNVGVIGIAFFGETGDSFVPESETRLRDTRQPVPRRPALRAAAAPLSSRPSSVLQSLLRGSRASLVGPRSAFERTTR